MPVIAITVINMTISALIYLLINRWYLTPKLKTMSIAEALQPLLLLHGMRHIGLVFLSSGVARPGLAQEFAIPAAYGDLAAAILALVALAALRSKFASAIPLVWLFNIVGTVDLFAAIIIGIKLDATAYMGAGYFLPAVIVPALLVTHYVVFQLLLKRKVTTAS